MFSNSELTDGALQLLTMTKCQFMCSVLQLFLEFMILWPAKLTARVTQNMEQLSPCRKRIISALASMIWWLGGTLATYWIYHILTNYYEQIHTPTQGIINTGTVEDTTHTHSIIKRAIQEGFVTENPCFTANWINNPICNQKLNTSSTETNTFTTFTTFTTSSKQQQLPHPSHTPPHTH